MQAAVCCSPSRLLGQVFAAMKAHHAGVLPNTVHYSSAISACGTSGRWREAEQVRAPRLHC